MPGLPINWRLAESISAIKALRKPRSLTCCCKRNTALVPSRSPSIRTQALTSRLAKDALLTDKRNTNIGTEDHAQLFIMSGMNLD